MDVACTCALWPIPGRAESLKSNTAGARARVSPKTFTIVAKNFSKENKYVKSVTLNGKPLGSFILKHADIMAGGELVFEMSSSPR